MKRGAVTTWTTLTEEYLRGRDDFATLHDVMAATGASSSQASAALHSLRVRRVVDVIIDPAGKGWWYALPPENDTRLRVVLERTPESKPRRKRRTTRKEP